MVSDPILYSTSPPPVLRFNPLGQVLRKPLIFFALRPTYKAREGINKSSRSRLSNSLLKKDAVKQQSYLGYGFNRESRFFRVSAKNGSYPVVPTGRRGSHSSLGGPFIEHFAYSRLQRNSWWNSKVIIDGIRVHQLANHKTRGSYGINSKTMVVGYIRHSVLGLLQILGEPGSNDGQDRRG